MIYLDGLTKTTKKPQFGNFLKAGTPEYSQVQLITESPGLDYYYYYFILLCCILFLILVLACN
jgi:hypothetical protein